MSAREPLYQGTTLVVPGSAGEDEALATAAFLFFNVSTQLSPDQKLPFPPKSRKSVKLLWKSPK
jgi:hypothetical protein